MEIGHARGDLSLRQRTAKQRWCYLAMWCEQTVWKRIWCWHAVREEERRGGWRKYTQCRRWLLSPPSPLPLSLE